MAPSGDFPRSAGRPIVDPRGRHIDRALGLCHAFNMIFNRLALVLFGAVLATSGCAFTDINMRMPADVEDVPGSVGAGRSISVVVPFVESRGEHIARCGMQKNGYNMDTADATCSKPPTQWIGTLLAQELRQAGFDVSVVPTPGGMSNENVPVVEGELVKLFVEPVIGFWSGSLEADLHVNLRVRRGDGLDAQRDFFQKGIRSGVMASVTPIYETALTRATNEIVWEMVAEVANLLDKYPSGGN